MPFVKQKYSQTALWVLLFFLQGFLWGGCGRMQYPAASTVPAVETPAADTAARIADALPPPPQVPARDTVPPVDTAARIPGQEPAALDIPADTAALDTLPPADSLVALPDSTALAADSLALNADSLRRYKYGKPMFDEVIVETNRDSMVYNLVTRRMNAYGTVEVGYGEAMKLTSEYVTSDLASKMIIARGVPDSTGRLSRSKFTDGLQEFDIVDSITYNLDSKKGKFRSVWTSEGDGFFFAEAGKKRPDNAIDVAHGFYTTCDAEHPHFGILINRGRMIPGKKTIFQSATLMIEDVEIPFLMLPFGFFPMAAENTSGVIIPSFGEEGSRGFFLRDGGYYLVLNEYLDLTATGSVYSLGSWETRLGSRYQKRYKFSGGLNFTYGSQKFGDRLSDDFQDTRTFSLAWQHSQDPKARPGQTFSASVNFSSSQQNKYSPQTINDFATNQTNSSITYSRNWAGTPFNLSVSANHSQINRDSTYSFTLPNASFSVSRINPFKFKNRRPGPERWYEKISLSYNTSLTNSVSSVKEYNLFKPAMFDQMETAMTHSLPVNANFSLGGLVTITPNLSYSENWNAKRHERRWDPETGTSIDERVKGFGRDYRFSGGVSANTTVYGMYDRFGPNSKFVAVRHTLNPSVSFSYSPDLTRRFFGLYKPYQADAAGTIGYYNPGSGATARAGSKPSASINFTLKQSVEAKVRSDQDSTGVRKIKIIDDLTIGSYSYNFMADEYKWSRTLPVSLRSTLIKGFNLNLSSSFGMYAFEDTNGDGRKEMVDKLLVAQGRLPRLESVGTSFNWSKSFGKGDPNAMNTNSNLSDPNQLVDPFNPMLPIDPMLDEMEDEEMHEHIDAYRSLQAGQYYDFSVPVNINFSYRINYTNNGDTRKIDQTASFGGSVNLTPKWGITVSSGYDFNERKIIPTTNFSMTRDLHCMEMYFNWVPFGRMKSWSFRVNVKANVLRDLKYEKNSSMYDNF